MLSWSGSCFLHLIRGQDSLSLELIKREALRWTAVHARNREYEQSSREVPRVTQDKDISDGAFFAVEAGSGDEVGEH